MQSAHIELREDRHNCILPPHQKSSIVHFNYFFKNIQEVNPHSELMIYQFFISSNGSLIKSYYSRKQTSNQEKEQKINRKQCVAAKTSNEPMGISVALPHSEHFLLPWK